MKWAAFEENVNNVEEAREILRQLVAKYPMLLEARSVWALQFSKTNQII